MYSYAAGWSDGKENWSVHHKGDEGHVDHLERIGELPQLFADIDARLRKEQRQADSDVDHIFETPVELFRALTGYRYDQDIEGSDEPFEILVPQTTVGAKPENRPWWKVW